MSSESELRRWIEEVHDQQPWPAPARKKTREEELEEEVIELRRTVDELRATCNRIFHRYTSMKSRLWTIRNEIYDYVTADEEEG